VSLVRVRKGEEKKQIITSFIEDLNKLKSLTSKVFPFLDQTATLLASLNPSGVARVLSLSEQ